MESSTNEDQDRLVPPVLDTIPADTRYSTLRKSKRPGRNVSARSNGMATSPRSRRPRPLSPRDGTPVIVNGSQVDRKSITPIIIPSPMMRPASPREAVPGDRSPRTQRTPSRLSDRSPRPTYISPASPTTFIPSETPALSNVQGSVSSYVPPITSTPSPRRQPPTRRQPSPPRRQPSPPRRQPSPPRRQPSPPRRQPSPPRRQPSPPMHLTPSPVPLPSLPSVKSLENLNEEEDVVIKDVEEIGGEVVINDEEEKEEEENDKETDEDINDNVEDVESESKIEDVVEDEDIESESKIEDVVEDEDIESESKIEDVIEDEDIESESKIEDVIEDEDNEKATVEEIEYNTDFPPEEKGKDPEDKPERVPKVHKKRKKKRQPRVKKYKSTIPPFLGPVLNVPEIPDYASMPEDERKQWREEFRIKFGLLRKGFRDYSIPDLDPEEPLEMIHLRYERYIRHIHISGAADSYRNYLLLYFLILEFIATKLLGLPANGFTMAQLNSMSRYEDLLIKLGEKWYVPGGSEWPVEYRIVFLSLFNMVLFIAMKWLAKYVGGENVSQALIDTIVGGVVNNNGNNMSPDTDPSAALGSGFDLGSLIGGITSMLGNNSNMSSTPSASQSEKDKGGRRRRGPMYRE